VSLDVVTQAPRANLVTDVYDVDPAGNATLVHRGTTRVDESGPVELELLGNDWRLPAGHRIGVLVTSSNSEWWLHVPTFQDVEVRSAAITLPFLAGARTERIAGGTAAKLEEYREEAPFPVEPATIAENTSPDFSLPPAQSANDADEPTVTTTTTTSTRTSAPPGGAAAAASPRAAVRSARSQATTRLAVRLVRRGRSVVVSGRAPRGSRVVVRLRRGASTVAARNVTARRGTFRVTFGARRHGRYRATVATLSGTLASAASRPLVIRSRRR
jgi:hypothetical protein